MKQVVSIILRDEQNKILLQLRDCEPELNKWVTFGGLVEKDETPLQAIHREILEELEYQLKKPEYFGTYQLANAECIAYVQEEPVQKEELILHEGAGMQFFTEQEIETQTMGFDLKVIIQDYFRSKN